MPNEDPNLYGINGTNTDLNRMAPSVMEKMHRIRVNQTSDALCLLDVWKYVRNVDGIESLTKSLTRLNTMIRERRELLSRGAEKLPNLYKTINLGRKDPVRVRPAPAPVLKRGQKQTQLEGRRMYSHKVQK